MAKNAIPDEVIQTAMMIDLPRFLRAQGIELKEYSTCWEYGQGPEKVTVWADHRDGHYQWKRQYDAMSGNSIQWMLAFGGSRSFPDAVYHLYDWAGGKPITQIKPDVAAAIPREEKRKYLDFRLPPAEKSFSRVMAYLCVTRKIAPEVVKAFHKAGLIYESAIYHNAVFVGRDKAGVARHANLRSTCTNEKGRAFKMNQEGSDSKCSFSWRGESPYLVVCEAPVDVLSFISIHPQQWQKHSYLALCGTFPDALEQFLKDQPNISKVFLALDNDDAGRKGNARCGAILDKLGVGYQIRIPKNNDWNDDLKEAQA